MFRGGGLRPEIRSLTLTEVLCKPSSPFLFGTQSPPISSHVDPTPSPLPRKQKNIDLTYLRTRLSTGSLCAENTKKVLRVKWWIGGGSLGLQEPPPHPGIKRWKLYQDSLAQTNTRSSIFGFLFHKASDFCLILGS